jgi:hypothetical protein
MFTLYVPDDVLEEASAYKLPTKSKLRYQKELEKFTRWQTQKQIAVFIVEDYTVCISKR